MPCYTNLVMHKIWDIAKITPQAALDWLSMQVARNRHVQTRLLSTLPDWVEPHLLAHGNAKVKDAGDFVLLNYYYYLFFSRKGS